jgi:hypothetical protein
MAERGSKALACHAQAFDSRSHISRPKPGGFRFTGGNVTQDLGGFPSSAIACTAMG